MTKMQGLTILELIIMAAGMALLRGTTAYYLPYLIVAVFSVFCMFKKADIEKKWHLYLAPVIYGLVLIGANYELWTSVEYPDGIGLFVRGLHGITLFLSLFLCGYFQAYHILKYLLSAPSIKAVSSRELKPFKVFLIFFLLIAALDMFILFTCRYPGNVSSDSLTQIKMFMEGWYNNHHPFFHTQTIRLFMSLGLLIFHDLNAAVAVYSVFQIIFMAACFSASVMTLYEAFPDKKYYIGVGLFFLLSPFHINYSFTMWKDVMFGGFLLLFVVYLFRTIDKLGKMVVNKALLSVASMGVCLFRSNGYILFLIVVITFFILFREIIFSKEKSNVRFTSGLFLGVLIISYILKHPFMAAMDVSQPDTVEKLSIPLQQVARTIVEYNDLTEDEIEIVEGVVSKDRMAEVYYPIYSDPEKDLIRSEGNQNYIAENKLEFALFYIELGLRHPDSYLKAWVDQTVGYWNSGYDYWRWTDDMTAREGYDLYRIVNSDFVNRHFNEYLWIFENNPVLVLLMCIGFYVWIDWLMFYRAAANGDKLGLVLAMPIIALVFTLQISTPVYSEFRYVYSIFCQMPFLLFVVMSGRSRGVC